VSWRAEVGGIEVVFGAGAVDGLGSLAGELGGRRAFVVTDPGVRKAGHADRALAALTREGVATCLFDGVGENPTTAEVEAGRDLAAGWQPDLLVAVGGGSAMDCAKGINLLLTNGGRMEDYRGLGRAARPLLPSIGVPTTAGTGSDAQSFALISRADTHEKMACGDRQARFRRVVLDPTLALSAPRRVIAATGLDALSHAVESHVCRRANPVSRLFSREAWRLLAPAFARAIADWATPGAPEETAMGDLLLGAHLAGAAIEASMLGAAHACANPLTARFGVVHGVAVALMLPPVVRFNAGVAEPLYADLAGVTGEEVAQRIEELRAAAALPGRLSDLGIGRGDLGVLADEAAGQWTAGFNPRPVAAADLLHLYEQAY
jgi:alcohol dehydrogenase class IV